MCYVTMQALAFWALFAGIQHVLSAPGPQVQRQEQRTFISFPTSNTRSKCQDLKYTQSLMEGSCSITKASIKFGGECVILLSQGPCPDGFWVVINKQCEPECRRKGCPGKTVPYKGSCVNPSVGETCGVGEIMYLEFNGEAYCDCEPLAIYDPQLKQCVYEHSQGSCHQGQYLEKSPTGSLECVTNPCKDDNLILSPDNGSCYYKQYVGKCPVGKGSEIIYNQDGTAECMTTEVGTRNIFEVPALNSCPSGSKRDHLNNCRQVFQFQSRSAGLRIPTQHVNSFNFCPTGYVRYPNKTCKKPNSLFGR